MWALGNYSFFIRPGYSVVSMTGADDLDTVAGTAYIAPDKSRIVMVFVNSGFSEEDISILLPKNYEKRISKVSVYVTDAGHDLSMEGNAKRRMEWKLAPRALSTIVINLK